jgi:hypothetical protein
MLSNYLIAGVVSGLGSLGLRPRASARNGGPVIFHPRGGHAVLHSAHQKSEDVKPAEVSRIENQYP